MIISTKRIFTTTKPKEDVLDIGQAYPFSNLLSSAFSLVCM